MKEVLSLVVLASILSGFAQTQRANVTLPDMHNSRNSLDWAGTYEGVLQIGNRGGEKTRLTLNNDGSYQRVTRYPGQADPATIVTGSFTWNANGNAIGLDEQGGRQQFFVGEEHLTLVNYGEEMAGSRASNPVLTKVPHVQTTPTGDDLAQTLQNNRWTLESATDTHNQPIAVLAPQKDRSVTFTFSGNRLSIQGPCNRMMGGYQISAAGQLTVSAAASGMMACDLALMKGDAILARVLAKPLYATLSRGAALHLTLSSAENETLVLTGQATPESLYGPPSIIFLEVSAQQVLCKNPPPPKTTCLEVRERHYDEQGLSVGTPGQWQALAQNIEGYVNEQGIRNVLRVKRYNRKSVSSDGPPTLYVLDIVVESEVAPKK
jgi:heat shock protein HslJ